MSEINGNKPYETSNIEEGDMIISINNHYINSTEELIKCVNSSNGNSLNIEYIHDGTKYNTNISPTRTTSNEYKLGLWVKDGAAGIGTITYYEPNTQKFAALGHGIVDADTEKLISISNGEILTTSISSITKGDLGTPGQIKGNIINGQNLGIISNNTEFGVYGNLFNTTMLNINIDNQLEVALRDEIKVGAAKVLLTLEDNTRNEYDIQIEKIYKNNNCNNKSMLIKITDEKLLELTGGIIQGMSGAPIIQNGKFIGAITHVLVSDPQTRLCCFWGFNDKRI